MRIILEKPQPPGAEDEIIIRCNDLDPELMELIYALSAGRTRLSAYSENGAVKLQPKDIYYFEAVDNKVFAYCDSQVYEIKMKLYSIEETLERSDFLRISKSMIVNAARIERIMPSLSGRLEAILSNGEKVIISRQYVGNLKKKLGL